MTDRELLEAAAKAAGYQPQGMEDGKLYLFGVQEGWNPLTDDGDALRLAVKLRIDLQFGMPGRVCAYSSPAEDWLAEMGDPYPATRRAIVRAAAEVGMTPNAELTGLGRNGG